MNNQELQKFSLHGYDQQIGTWISQKFQQILNVEKLDASQIKEIYKPYNKIEELPIEVSIQLGEDQSIFEVKSINCVQVIHIQEQENQNTRAQFLDQRYLVYKHHLFFNQTIVSRLDNSLVDYQVNQQNCIILTKHFLYLYNQNIPQLIIPSSLIQPNINQIQIFEDDQFNIKHKINFSIIVKSNNQLFIVGFAKGFTFEQGTNGCRPTHVSLFYDNPQILFLQYFKLNFLGIGNQKYITNSQFSAYRIILQVDYIDLKEQKQTAFYNVSYLNHELSKINIQLITSTQNYNQIKQVFKFKSQLRINQLVEQKIYIDNKQLKYNQNYIQKLSSTSNRYADYQSYRSSFFKKSILFVKNNHIIQRINKILKLNQLVHNYKLVKLQDIYLLHFQLLSYDEQHQKQLQLQFNNKIYTNENKILNQSVVLIPAKLENNFIVIPYFHLNQSFDQENMKLEIMQQEIENKVSTINQQMQISYQYYLKNSIEQEYKQQKYVLESFNSSLSSFNSQTQSNIQPQTIKFLQNKQNVVKIIGIQQQNQGNQLIVHCEETQLFQLNNQLNNFSQCQLILKQQDYKQINKQNQELTVYNCKFIEIDKHFYIKYYFTQIQECSHKEQETIIILQQESDIINQLSFQIINYTEQLQLQLKQQQCEKFLNDLKEFNQKLDIVKNELQVGEDIQDIDNIIVIEIKQKEIIFILQSFFNKMQDDIFLNQNLLLTLWQVFESNKQIYDFNYIFNICQYIFQIIRQIDNVLILLQKYQEIFQVIKFLLQKINAMIISTSIVDKQTIKEYQNILFVIDEYLIQLQVLYLFNQVNGQQQLEQCFKEILDQNNQIFLQADQYIKQLRNNNIWLQQFQFLMQRFKDSFVLLNCDCQYKGYIQNEIIDKFDITKQDINQNNFVFYTLSLPSIIDYYQLIELQDENLLFQTLNLNFIIQMNKSFKHLLMNGQGDLKQDVIVSEQIFKIVFSDQGQQNKGMTMSTIYYYVENVIKQYNQLKNVDTIKKTYTDIFNLVTQKIISLETNTQKKQNFNQHFIELFIELTKELDYVKTDHYSNLQNYCAYIKQINSNQTQNLKLNTQIIDKIFNSDKKLLEQEVLSFKQFEQLKLVQKIALLEGFKLENFIQLSMYLLGQLLNETIQLQQYIGILFTITQNSDQNQTDDAVKNMLMIIMIVLDKIVSQQVKVDISQFIYLNIPAHYSKMDEQMYSILQHIIGNRISQVQQIDLILKQFLYFEIPCCPQMIMKFSDGQDKQTAKQLSVLLIQKQGYDISNFENFVNSFKEQVSENGSNQVSSFINKVIEEVRLASIIQNSQKYIEYFFNKDQQQFAIQFFSLFLQTKIDIEVLKYLTQIGLFNDNKKCKLFSKIIRLKLAYVVNDVQQCNKFDQEINKLIFKLFIKLYQQQFQEDHENLYALIDNSETLLLRELVIESNQQELEEIEYQLFSHLLCIYQCNENPEEQIRYKDYIANLIKLMECYKVTIGQQLDITMINSILWIIHQQIVQQKISIQQIFILVQEQYITINNIFNIEIQKFIQLPDNQKTKLTLKVLINECTQMICANNLKLESSHYAKEQIERMKNIFNFYNVLLNNSEEDLKHLSNIKQECIINQDQNEEILMVEQNQTNCKISYIPIYSILFITQFFNNVQNNLQQDMLHMNTNVELLDKVFNHLQETESNQLIYNQFYLQFNFEYLIYMHATKKIDSDSQKQVANNLFMKMFICFFYNKNIATKIIQFDEQYLKEQISTEVIKEIINYLNDLKIDDKIEQFNKQLLNSLEEYLRSNYKSQDQEYQQNNNTISLSSNLLSQNLSIDSAKNEHNNNLSYQSNTNQQSISKTESSFQTQEIMLSKGVDQSELTSQTRSQNELQVQYFKDLSHDQQLKIMINNKTNDQQKLTTQFLEYLKVNTNLYNYEQLYKIGKLIQYFNQQFKSNTILQPEQMLIKKQIINIEQFLSYQTQLLSAKLEKFEIGIYIKNLQELLQSGCLQITVEECQNVLSNLVLTLLNSKISDISQQNQDVINETQNDIKKQLEKKLKLTPEQYQKNIKISKVWQDEPSSEEDNDERENIEKQQNNNEKQEIQKQSKNNWFDEDESDNSQDSKQKQLNKHTSSQINNNKKQNKDNQEESGLQTIKTSQNVKKQTKWDESSSESAISEKPNAQKVKHNTKLQDRDQDEESNKKFIYKIKQNFTLNSQLDIVNLIVKNNLKIDPKVITESYNLNIVFKLFLFCYFDLHNQNVEDLLFIELSQVINLEHELFNISTSLQSIKSCLSTFILHQYNIFTIEQLTQLLSLQNCNVNEKTVLAQLVKASDKIDYQYVEQLIKIVENKQLLDTFFAKQYKIFQQCCMKQTSLNNMIIYYMQQQNNKNDLLTLAYQYQCVTPTQQLKVKVLQYVLENEICTIPQIEKMDIDNIFVSLVQKDTIDVNGLIIILLIMQQSHDSLSILVEQTKQQPKYKQLIVFGYLLATIDCNGLKLNKNQKQTILEIQQLVCAFIKELLQQNDNHATINNITGNILFAPSIDFNYNDQGITLPVMCLRSLPIQQFIDIQDQLSVALQNMQIYQDENLKEYISLEIKNLDKSVSDKLDQSLNKSSKSAISSLMQGVSSIFGKK